MLEYLFSVNKTFKQAAKDFGVTPRQLEKFALGDPKKNRAIFNRSPLAKNLFAQGEATSVRAKTRQIGKTLKRVKFTEADIQVYRSTPGIEATNPQEVNRRIQIGEMIQGIYIPKEPRHEWARYSEEHRLPVSVKTAKLLYRNRKISYQDWINYTQIWSSIYGKSYEDIDRLRGFG